ncbi:MAG: membrane protein insertase YidC [Candidatus Pacebacteria bacterium]|nr:membrane protein insertase YidC [Candidatus Paceibacterota bacterium]
MLLNLWNTFLYEPFLNLLALLVSVVPFHDLGIAVILLTILVKFILFPLSQKSLKGQAKVREMQPELEKIKNSGKTKEEQARLTFELYKKYNTNPFSGCLLILIQIPIIFALYYVFYKGLNFNPEVLYSFIPKPDYLNTIFLGLIDISQKSLVLAIIAGLSQFFVASFMPKPKKSENKDPNKMPSFAESLSESMHVQMKYVFPFVVAFIAYSISGAIALYWATSNIFGGLQQMYINKKSKLLVTTSSIASDKVN